MNKAFLIAAALGLLSSTEALGKGEILQEHHYDKETSLQIKVPVTWGDDGLAVLDLKENLPPPCSLNLDKLAPKIPVRLSISFFRNYENKKYNLSYGHNGDYEYAGYNYAYHSEDKSVHIIEGEWLQEVLDPSASGIVLLSTGSGLGKYMYVWCTVRG